MEVAVLCDQVPFRLLVYMGAVAERYALHTEILNSGQVAAVISCVYRRFVQGNMDTGG